MTRLLLMWTLAMPVLAGESDEPPDPTTTQMASEPASIPGVPPGPPPDPATVPETARGIALGLRCPVCQGLSVADSTSSAAVLMYRRVQELVAQGYQQPEIDAYFVSKYGEWVLLAPTTDGFNRVVWIGPAIAAGIGLLLAVTFLRGGQSAPAAPAARVAVDDPYARRILSEVDDD